MYWVLAAVMIVIFHYNAVTLMIPEVNKPILLFVHYANGSMGHIGVSLFFILAGASLMYSSMEKLDLKQYFKNVFSLYSQFTGRFIRLFCI